MKYLIILLACLFSSTAFAQVSFSPDNLNVVIVFDDSGSMGERLSSNRNMDRMTMAKQALSQVVQKLPENTNLGITLLNGQWQPENWAVPLQKINKPQILATIEAIQPTGGTPLGGCVKEAANTLLAKRAKEPYGTYRLLVVTDGEATDGNLINECVPEIIGKGISIDAIGLDMSGNHTLATKVTNYRNASDVQTLTLAISETFAESSVDDLGADFEALQGFPDDVANELIPRITRMDNTLVGEAPVDQDNTQISTTGLVQNSVSICLIVVCVVGVGFLFFLIWVIAN